MNLVAKSNNAMELPPFCSVPSRCVVLNTPHNDQRAPFTSSTVCKNFVVFESSRITGKEWRQKNQLSFENLQNYNLMMMMMMMMMMVMMMTQ